MEINYGKNLKSFKNIKTILKKKESKNEKDFVIL